MSKIELKRMTELGRLFITFFRAYMEDETVPESDIRAAYNIIEEFAGKDAATTLEELHGEQEYYDETYSDWE